MVYRGKDRRQNSPDALTMELLKTLDTHIIEYKQFIALDRKFKQRVNNFFYIGVGMVMAFQGLPKLAELINVIKGH